ncbi:hypothetical protein ABW45_08000 [Stenotrophomonas maltophilia]|uniref:Uncharacterized protein n=1 Tax=Stenotrophomonas maltophilia TaxID=40324 RepID=A0AB34TI68_STEMA|nr:hypothetical protein VL23_05800 [Stenotrophomonas maltophilia]KOQ78059.1 hypothetical protein ABW45_08000 [Stenotrophomonas maltophilia]
MVTLRVAHLGQGTCSPQKYTTMARSARPAFPPARGRRLAVASGYGAQSYALGLEIALEHLRLAEDSDRFHVGT